MSRLLPALFLSALLISCGPAPPRPEAGPETLAPFPLEPYQHAPADRVYRLDPAQSEADILVRRGGPLARFGHDHVVSAKGMEGLLLWVKDRPESSIADVRIDLKTLSVDEQELREDYSLDTRPSAEDIAKTRENMQSRVLQTVNWPEMHLHVEGKSSAADGLNADLTVYLHGGINHFPTVIGLHEQNDGVLWIQGEFTLRQSDYGIEPFSVLAGGLTVQDEVQVSYRLIALPVTPVQR